AGGAVGVAEHAVAEPQGGARRLLGGVAVDERGEVELELVPFAARVRALDLAELALEAEVHDTVGLRGRHAAHVAPVLLVDETEEGREGVAVLEAETTPVTDLVRALDLLGVRGSCLVLRFRRIKLEPFGRLLITGS